jgi:uncharacterized Fe-S cluster protein YjdI
MTTEDYSHASECVNNLRSVFRLNSRPWINPDSARAEEIIDTISPPFLFSFVPLDIDRYY